MPYHSGEQPASEFTHMGRPPLSKTAKHRRVKNRLREIRESKGSEWTLDYVSGQIGTTAAQLSRLELGQRRLSDFWMAKLAAVYDVDVRDLLGPNAAPVPVIGYVASGEVIAPFSLSDEEDRTKEPPPGADKTECVLVRSDSLWPAYQPGDYLFFFPAHGIGDDCLGKDCIVETRDGARYVKTVRKGSRPGLYRLTSHRGAEMDDIELAWASRVR